MVSRLDPALVALRLPPGTAFLAALERIWTNGDAVLPLPVDVPDAALERILARLRPAVILDEHAERRLDGAVGVAVGTALVIATSGSTGHPKGVVLSHSALEASTRASLARLGSRFTTGAGAEDRWLCCLPVSHIAGLQVLLRARALGGAAIIHPAFRPEAVAREAAATAISLVPTMLARLLDAGVDVSRFAHILLGGAPASADLLTRARRAGARITITYGMTETCGGCVYDGVPLDGVTAVIDHDHRISLRGDVLFDGYRLDSGETDRVLHQGWFLTGDRGHWAADGTLQVTGRLDDIILTGGVNVPAREVASLLAGYPGVCDAVVYGKPDDEWGQRVVAVIAVNGTPPTLDELRAFVRRSAPASYAPKQLTIVEQVPRTPLGKPDLEALRRLEAP